ncbi:putative ubiquitin conjugating enzyme [Patellaria atrata CBS 101060]|uniref:Ubiquitin-conjugating enzyme E2 2 n=1 Tax=Patellaria atrata CBS 101060 TaxID=1346257 RepID=A0A9P4SGK9_9PEZI|nr:putative ubiquitin conjugating enzyme [Patellaria atrata CBS 101060]
MAERILMNEYRTLSKEPWTNIDLINENIYEWSVALIVLNPDSLYYGGYFKAKMTFKKEYPYVPPDFKFLRPLYHPNIYPDGRLCISILHAPGEDEQSGELAAERWSPAQRVESVLLSILSLLDDAEVSSPANVDAGVMLRNDIEGYKKMVKKDLEASKEDIPPDYVMPTHHDAFKTVKNDDFNMDDWADSDDEPDFGGSDSDEDMDHDWDASGDEEEADDDDDEGDTKVENKS